MIASCAVLVVGPVAGPASADPTAPAATVPVMVVLDASGSMTTSDAPGRRIDAARRAVLALVSGLPAGARLGLEVYGANTGSAAADKAAGCRDVDVVAPVAPLRRAAVTSAVRAVRARGYTPIGAALERADAALPPNAAAGIVLVSDGIDTCGPRDPCTVAERLKAGHRDLVVHTIGFRADRSARAQLRCIARVTGGTYRDAVDGAALGPALDSQVAAGLRPYVVEGKPIDGTTTPAGAPLVAVGQYTDAFARGPATTKYYSVDLAAPVTAHLTTTVVPPALRGGGGPDRLRVTQRLLDQDGDRCLPTEREDDTVLGGKVDPVSVVLSGVVGGPSWSERCPTQGRFVLEVTRDSTSTTMTRSETVIGLEAPVVPPTRLSAAPSGALPAPTPTRASGRCAGGASFDTASRIGDRTCADTLATGETRYYRVHLDWGLRFSYRVDVDRVPGARHGTGYVRSAVMSPLREHLAVAATSDAPRVVGRRTSIELAGATAVPVAYGNRVSARSDVRPYAQAGDYFLSLGLSYPVDARPGSAAVRLSIAVSGRAQPGPRHVALPAARPPLTSSSPSAANATSRARRGQEGAADGDHTSLWVGVGSLVVGAVGAAIAVTALRRRAGRLDRTPQEG